MASTSSIACGSPAITEDRGLLLTATAIRSAWAWIARAASSIDRSTMAIAPWPLVRFSKRLRRQTTAAAASRLNAPATCAAATSPML